jgi:hypothetical protein
LPFGSVGDAAISSFFSRMRIRRAEYNRFTALLYHSDVARKPYCLHRTSQLNSRIKLNAGDAGPFFRLSLPAIGIAETEMQ